MMLDCLTVSVASLDLQGAPSTVASCVPPFAPPAPEPVSPVSIRREGNHAHRPDLDHRAARGRARRLISILEEVQATYGYLPAARARNGCRSHRRSLVDIYGVATFYRAFSLKPRGKHLCTVCLGTACHVRGAPAVAGEFQKQLGVRPGQTTPDKEFTLDTVNCLGACALGPIVVVDGRYHSNVSTSKVRRVLDDVRLGLQAVDVRRDERVFPIDVSCPRCNHSLMDPRTPSKGIRRSRCS
jgi:NADH-quinone oxidoreductase subunit E